MPRFPSVKKVNGDCRLTTPIGGPKSIARDFAIGDEVRENDRFHVFEVVSLLVILSTCWPPDPSPSEILPGLTDVVCVADAAMLRRPAP
jgi:hypothetical protein